MCSQPISFSALHHLVIILYHQDFFLLWWCLFGVCVILYIFLSFLLSQLNADFCLFFSSFPCFEFILVIEFDVVLM